MNVNTSLYSIEFLKIQKFFNLLFAIDLFHELRPVVAANEARDATLEQ
jgi:hypothetical protein